MSMTLKQTNTENFVPHPEGIFPAVCVDVIDLGQEETEYQGEKRIRNCVRVAFETEAKMDDGKPFFIAKKFTASLHQKAKLAEFIGKWRGRAVEMNESIDLGKLIGASCTLVISQNRNIETKKIYSGIDAISKPTKKMVPSGHYDPAAARVRINEYRAKKNMPPLGTPLSTTPKQEAPKSAVAPDKDDIPMDFAAKPAAAGPNTAFDPELGF